MKYKEHRQTVSPELVIQIQTYAIKADKPLYINT